MKRPAKRREIFPKKRWTRGNIRDRYSLRGQKGEKERTRESPLDYWKSFFLQYDMKDVAKGGNITHKSIILFSSARRRK